MKGNEDDQERSFLSNKQNARKPSQLKLEQLEIPCRPSSHLSSWLQQRTRTFSTLQTFGSDNYAKCSRLTTAPKLAALHKTSDYVCSIDDSLSSKCDRCKEIVYLLKELLTEMKCLRIESEFKCAHCMVYDCSSKCSRCVYLTRKFLTSDLYSKSKYLYERYSKWVLSVKKVLKHILEAKMLCSHLDCSRRSTANDELERLIQELQKPLFPNIPKRVKITNFPFDDEESETDISLILEKNFNEFSEKDALQKIISQETYSSAQIKEQIYPYRLSDLIKRIRDLIDGLGFKVTESDKSDKTLKKTTDGKADNGRLKLPFGKYDTKKKYRNKERSGSGKKDDTDEKHKTKKKYRDKESDTDEPKEVERPKKRHKKKRSKNYKKGKRDKFSSNESEPLLPSQSSETTNTNISTDSDLYTVNAEGYLIERTGFEKHIIIGDRLLQFHKTELSKLSHMFKTTDTESTAPLLVPPSSTIESRPETIKKRTKDSGTKRRRQTAAFKYQLSDRRFIDNGYTILPKIVTARYMRFYKMVPTNSVTWFDIHIDTMYYDTGEILSSVDEFGNGKWYYRNGVTALDYYKCADDPGDVKYIVYSSGEMYGQKKHITILACFDYHGNGIVYDHCGKIRLKYNQSEGQVIDSTIAPPGRWIWHRLNEPPDLGTTYAESHEDLPTEILNTPTKAGNGKESRKNLIDTRSKVQFENLQKRESLLSNYEAAVVSKKIVKLNAQFTLHIKDQSHIVLRFREKSVTFQLELGMKLDDKHILSKKKIGAIDVYTPFDYNLEPITECLSHIRKVISETKHLSKNIKGAFSPCLKQFTHRPCRLNKI